MHINQNIKLKTNWDTLTLATKGFTLSKIVNNYYFDAACKTFICKNFNKFLNSLK